MRGRTQILAVALVLWAGCAAVRTSPPTGTWPDVNCPAGNAMAMLNEIVALAEAAGRADVAAKARECLEQHTGVTCYHCAKVRAAWCKAQEAVAETDPAKKTIHWNTCLDELTHPPN